MLRRFFVKNFRKNASLRERFFGHFIFLTGKMRLIPRLKLLTSNDLENAKDTLMVGDLVFVGVRGEISQFFIRGVLSHVLIYMGKHTFIHSNLKYGVTEIRLEELFEKYDYLTIYRPSDVTACQVRQVVEFAKNAIGTAYDFRFLKENKDELYCTKLIYLAYQKAGIELKSSLTSHWLSFFSITHPADFVMHNFTQKFASQSLCEVEKRQTKTWTMYAKEILSRIFMALEKI